MIRLHHCHQTRSMRVLWLLEELGAEYELVVHPFDKSLRSDAFLALSPAGRVPALELDGAVYFESGAIAEILCERFDRLWRPPGDVARGAWLSWLHFAETVSQHAAALTQQHVALYDDAMRSPIVMKLEAKRLEKCYGAIEAGLAEYLVPGGFSAADIAVGQAVYMARHFARIEPFPKLSAWYERITERPGVQAALPPEGARLYQKAFYPAWSP